MFSLSRALVAGAALIASVNAGDNFIQTQTRTLSITRVDPLMTPGANGPHVHNVIGASSFSPDSTTPESLENAKCTTTMIGDDKSIYWTPLVYYNMGNGSYTPIIGNSRIYYFLKPGNGTKPVVAFPRGHRMLAGAPSDSRPATYPPRGQLSYDQQQAMDPRVNAIKWGCAAGAVQGQGNGGYLDGQRPYLPNDAPNGCGVLNAGIFYPSCGDGRLDSPDHFSHMAYPLDGPEGYNCAPSHPIKYPTIFLENFYFMNDQQPYRGPNTDNWVLSNGDTLGLTMHADFINGWVPGSLENILNSCNTPNAPGDNLQACDAIWKSVSVDNADNCRSEGNIVEEDVGLLAPINALPGCNPIWPVDARTKPTCKGSQVSMGQPTSRLEIPTLKLGLPVYGGQSKVVAAPSGANNSYSYSYSSTSSYASTSSATTSSITSTSSAVTTSATEAATTSTSEAVTSSSAAATSTTDAATSSSSSSSSAVPTTTSSYSAPNEYYGSSTSSSSSASASTSDTYVYPASSSAPAAGASSSTSASQSSSASAAAAAAATSPASSSSSSSSPTSTSAAPTSTASAAGAPGSGPATTSTNPPASVANAPHGSSSTNTMHINPSTSKAATSTGSASTSTPTPQNANAVGSGTGSARPPKKTCAHRKHHNHGHRRRDWKKGMIN